MKKILLLIFALHFSLSAAGVDKAKFDLAAPAFQKHATLSGDGLYYLLYSNPRSEVSLIDGGYFTIGTTNGLSENQADNACEITFGHPFAKTSYPVFSIDGKWFKFDEYFSEPEKLVPFQMADTLFIRATEPELCSIEFSIFANQFGNQITVRQKIVNLSEESHQFGTGIVLDPALGKWGDGCLEINNNFQKNDTLLTSAASPFSIWEKSVGAKGLGIEIQSTPALAKVIAANWPDAYAENAPEFSESELRTLYDLVLKFYWNETEMEPGAVQTNEITIFLNQPDFPNEVLLRWDLPSIFVLVNGQLFPRGFNSYVETANIRRTTVSGTVTLDLPEKFSANRIDLPTSVPGNSQASVMFDLNPKTSFENKIVELSARFEKNGQIVDEISRNVFLPAVPLVDTGLVVVADSVVTDNFPEVNLIFGVEVEKTGQRILNLMPENIFLFENGMRIKDFQLGSVATEGSNLADVVFVLDCSGSMGDDIAAVRSNLNEFADSLQSKGFDYQIGVVTFSTTVTDVWDFTNNIEQISDNLAGINLWGGIEDSPAALYKASELSWRPNSRRNIIWITDEPYPLHSYSKEQIVNRMLEMGIRVHGIGLTNLQTEWFNPIVLPTGGNFYDITGNFRDILLDVTNIGQQSLHSLIYTSPSLENSVNEIKLELHFGNWGGIKTFEYSVPTFSSSQLLTCFPNPFNPEVRFLINTRDYLEGEIQIYNILGRLVKSFAIHHNSKPEIIWHACNEAGYLVGSGVYLVRLSLMDSRRKMHHQTAKILHVK